MQKTSTPRRRSEDDQFADNSEEDAEEVDTPLLPLFNTRFADDIDLLRGNEEELQQFTEKLHAENSCCT